MSDAKYAAQIKHLRTHYKKVALDMKKEDYEAFKTLCESQGKKPTAVIKQLIAKYMEENQ